MKSIDNIADDIAKMCNAQHEIGLSGKMGASLFLFRYSRLNHNHLANKAEALLNEVADYINSCNSCNFYTGITGIGWAIEYISQNKFIDIDVDDMLEEFDKVLLAANFHRLPIHENSLIFEYGIYFLKRVDKNKFISLKKKQILLFLVEEIEKSFNNNNYHRGNIPVLNLHLLNSVLFFISKIYQIDILNKKKISRIILCLMEYIIVSLKQGANHLSDCMITSELLEKNIAMIYNNPVSIQLYFEIKKKILESKTNMIFEVRDIDTFAWDPIIYDLHISTKDYISFLELFLKDKKIENKELINLGIILSQVK